MANFNDHLSQAKRNLNFLNRINQDVIGYIDWEITTCFYVAVHLINAHLAQSNNMHFKSHERVNEEINPYSSNNKTKLDEDRYYSYNALRNLSRRSRYLLDEDGKNPELCSACHFKHLIKAIKQLDKLLIFMNKKYMSDFDVISVDITGEFQSVRGLKFIKIQSK